MNARRIVDMESVSNAAVARPYIYTVALVKYIHSVATVSGCSGKNVRINFILHWPCLEPLPSQPGQPVPLDPINPVLFCGPRVLLSNGGGGADHQFVLLANL